MLHALKNNKRLKKIALWFLSPKGQASPRWWIRVFINPWFHKKAWTAVIKSNVRKDLFPFNDFYLGENSTIENFCTLNNGVGALYIGNNSRLGLASVLIGPVEVGNDVRIAQNVVLSALNHNYEDVNVPISQQGVYTKQIVIGDETWIGANAVILPGVIIGKHCVIGAGSVVTKSVDDFSVVAGNPARLIKKYDTASKSWLKII